MSEKLYSEPAFPIESSSFLFEGMTLRDYFAAKAMQAMSLACLSLEQSVTDEYIAKEAYKQADAMLKERAK